MSEVLVARYSFGADVAGFPESAPVAAVIDAAGLVRIVSRAVTLSAGEHHLRQVLLWVDAVRAGASSLRMPDDFDRFLLLKRIVELEAAVVAERQRCAEVVSGLSVPGGEDRFSAGWIAGRERALMAIAGMESGDV